MDVFEQGNVKQLVQALLSCETEQECANFLEDLLTTREVLDISQRLKVAQLLRDGKTSGEISAACGASTTTISRVNRCYLYGAGGYGTVLERMEGGQEDA